MSVGASAASRTSNLSMMRLCISLSIFAVFPASNSSFSPLWRKEAIIIDSPHQVEHPIPRLSEWHTCLGIVTLQVTIAPIEDTVKSERARRNRIAAKQQRPISNQSQTIQGIEVAGLRREYDLIKRFRLRKPSLLMECGRLLKCLRRTDGALMDDRERWPGHVEVLCNCSTVVGAAQMNRLQESLDRRLAISGDLARLLQRAVHAVMQ